MADPVREAALALLAEIDEMSAHDVTAGRAWTVIDKARTLRAALAATGGAIPTASRSGANDAEAARLVNVAANQIMSEVAEAYESPLDGEDYAILRGAIEGIIKRVVPLYAAPLLPASAGEVETDKIVGWAMCFVPRGYLDGAAQPKLIFDSKERAEDVARRQTAFGIGEGARFIVRPITWAAERAQRDAGAAGDQRAASGDNKKGGA